MNYLIIGTSTNKNVENANEQNKNWKKTGTKQVAKFNAASPYIQYVHDVALVGDLIDRLTPDQQAKLLNPKFKYLLAQECKNIRKIDTESTTYCTLYTYVLFTVAKKFGTSAVATDSSNFKFRGFKDDPDIKEYARWLTRVTIDRALYQD